MSGFTTPGHSSHIGISSLKIRSGKNQEYQSTEKLM